MGWFSKSNRQPRFPEEKDLWTVCSSCKAYIFKAKWEENLRVCPKCNFHDKLTAFERLRLVVDEGTFEEFDEDIRAGDPLEFVDAKGSYAENARRAEEKTGLKEAILTGRGNMGKIPVVIGIMDFRFFGGSLAGSTGEKILLACDHAYRHKRPFVVFSASGGARMHEGIVSLMQMAKTCAGISRLNKARIPYISVLTDPTFGGVSASYATVGDVNLAEPGALVGFAGRRVIEQTIKQKLPKDFQTAEYLLAHGFIDRIVNRSEMKDCICRILQYWRAG